MNWLDWISSPVCMALLGLLAHACKKMARVKRDGHKNMNPITYVRQYPYQTVTAFIGMIVGLVVLKDTGELTALNSFTLGYMANSAVDIMGKKSALGGDKT